MRLHEAPSGMLALPMTDTIAEVPSLSNPRVSYSGLVSGASSAATIAATQFVAGSSRNFTDHPVESTQPPQQTALPAQSHQQTLQILAKRRVDDVVRETEAGPPRKRAKRSCRKCGTPSPDCRGAKEVKLCNNLCRDCGQRKLSAPEYQLQPSRNASRLEALQLLLKNEQRGTAAAQEGASRAESITHACSAATLREAGGTGAECSDRRRGTLEEVQCAQRCLLNSTTSDSARGYTPACPVPRSKGATKPRAGAIVSAYAREGSGGRRQRVQRRCMRDSRSICAHRCPGDPVTNHSLGSRDISTWHVVTEMAAWDLFGIAAISLTNQDQSSHKQSCVIVFDSQGCYRRLLDLDLHHSLSPRPSLLERRMDPLSMTMTVVTLATFIKDLIDVGQSIKRSIDKVSENRRQIRDVADDILRVLAEIADLSRGHEGQSQAPALLSALGDLRADMLYVLSACRKITPAQRSPGIRGFRSQIKVWMKRDDIEAKIRRLKEHVNKCYLQFTAFSAARIEATTYRTDNTTLRVEQSLIVNHVENQVKLQRLEGMMARVLLETQFGQDVMNRTMEIIASDTAHQTVEFQYLSAQALRLVNSLQLQLATTANNTLVPDTPLLNVEAVVLVKPVSATRVLYKILALTLQIDEYRAEIVFTSLQTIIHIGDFLAHLRMNSETIAWYRMTIQILRRCSGTGFHSHPGVLRNLALSSLNLSHHYQSEMRWDLAIDTSCQAMDLCRMWQELSPDLDYRPLLSGILIVHSENLRETGQLKDAISNAEEAVAVCCGMAGQLTDSGSELFWTAEDEWKAVAFLQALFTLAAAHASADRHLC
ncbi:hypothetical protein DFH09DRAFT_1455696 [Mycena vulgaris]|nr:hypothetical protein DFH09DRAFT_1455696 [Mycena vulgaris]